MCSLFDVNYITAFFTRNGIIVGRDIVDARVCASPGRDRGNDEAKVYGPVSSTMCSTSPDEDSVKGERVILYPSPPDIRLPVSAHASQMTAIPPAPMPSSGNVNLKREEYTINVRAPDLALFKIFF